MNTGDVNVILVPFEALLFLISESGQYFTWISFEISKYSVNVRVNGQYVLLHLITAHASEN